MVEKSPLLETKEVEMVKPDTYSESDIIYFGQIRVRLESAKMQRAQSYIEFGNMTYLEKYDSNKRKANTVLAQKKNPEDVVISSGTLEVKLEAVLSAINNLNLETQIRAYDSDNNLIRQAATVLEDVVFASNELDEDEEKKLMRQKELLIQGEVFVEEKWVQKFKKKKTLKGEFTGLFKGVEWTEKLEKWFEGPSRKVKYGPNIYLGDITQFYMTDQPYIFEVEVDTYENAKAIFGKWENWKYVQRSRTNESGTGNEALTSASGGRIDPRWTLIDTPDNHVEIITYQDRHNDEYNIIINGIMMLPAGFPLCPISPNGQYTIEKQVLKVVDAHFSYGRGFIQSVEKTSDILDEMMKLMVLKTRKSFMPAYINTSKKVISARVLQPGKITMGINAQDLQSLGENSEGVSSAEFQIIKELQDRIDRQTISPQFAGQQGKSGTTATEVMELQKQAKMTLGLIIFACSMLEKKVGYLRLWNILQNWFKPIDKKVINDSYQNKYRRTSRATSIPGDGMGERQVIPTDQEIPDSYTIRELERADEKTLGFPVQKLIINPDLMKNAIKNWYIVVSPTEKNTSDFQKALFREELADIAALVNFGAVPDINELEESFSKVWNRDKTKMFKETAPPMQPSEDGGMEGGIGDVNAAVGRPNIKGLPTTANV